MSSTQSDLDTAYSFTFSKIDGSGPLPLEQFAGKVILVVNTASKCGFTKQYTGLESLYQKYKDQGFVIVGVPSNNFGGQEPGDNAQIVNFCDVNYRITFPMAEKVKVRGKEAHPFYVWAKKKLGFGSGPKWNFHKYLINRKGELVDYFHSTTTPESKKLTDKIEELLKG